tara:strand:+ start:704 stop:1867 length:1164 start_codon:yes stop_codon:yes gene_type:complete
LKYYLLISLSEVTSIFIRIKSKIKVNLIKKRRVFPFTAVIGQEEMKLALLLNVIDPRIGGVMIMGDRGTGKSTTIRALADLLPAISVVKGDPYNSSPNDPDLQSQEVLEKVEGGNNLELDKKQVPMVDLPLGATEDRLCGTIDIEKALSEGIKAFEPGLLAKANRGLLYVDEVNLLDDHLVDVLLDSAASGWNTVEREGVSVRHPARFVLIGSGNPEEGELRPQLLDRFGMSVEVKTVRDADLRVKVVDQRTSFDNNPEEFSTIMQEKQSELQRKVVAAQEKLNQVKIDDDLRLNISAICGELDVDGLRGDIVTNRSAKAIAAFEGRDEVSDDDIARVITCSLRHRLRKDPLEQVDSGERVIKAFCKIFEIDEKDNLSKFQLALSED